MAMPQDIAPLTLEDPPFIKYLLNPKLKYECYFLIGNEKLNIAVERIGVVKKMLFAHSDVMRIELEESKIAEKDTVSVTDLCPDTFRNVLRYVYGYDNVDSLTFTDADNLLYAAEKYMISPLKGKVCSRLMALLTYENICDLLNNPACYQALELNATITQILQGETDKVLQSPQFLDLNPSAFLHILQQDRLQVPEIELWRSAIKWAKSRVGSEDGASLRAELNEHVKHIRVCTFSLEEFCYEVVPSRVLSLEEVAVVCESQKTKRKNPELTQVCNHVEPRPKMELHAPSEHVQPITITILDISLMTEIVTGPEEIILTNKQHGIQLMSLSFFYMIGCARQKDVIIKGPFMTKSGSVEDTVISFDMSYQDHWFDVFTMKNGECMQLLPHGEYRVIVKNPIGFRVFRAGRNSNRSFTHFNIRMFRAAQGLSSPLAAIKYKVVE